MKILFVYFGLPIGGIELFIVKIVKRLKQKNIHVKVLFYSNKVDKTLLEELKVNADVYFLDDYLYMSNFLKKNKPVFKLLFPIKIKKIKRDILNDITHLHAPDIFSILFSCKINLLKVPVTTGVYHVNEFNFNKFSSCFFGRKMEDLFSSIPEINVLFFNEISKEFYNREYNNKFDKAYIAPIGVELDKYLGKFSGVQNNRIVSIGRLTPWKMYNYHMIEVVKKLNDLGLPIRYESYGNGIERQNLMTLVKQLKLEKQVFFHNEIPYNLFKEKINNSLMFIGAGTALIEASASGIPSLIGIENEQKALSYGFLHDTNTYSYQEKQLGYKMLDIESFILKLKNSDSKDYHEQCNKARNRSKDFDIEKSSMIFIQMIESSEIWTWKNNWITNLLILISLIKHELFSKIKKDGKSFSLTRH